MMGPQGPQRGCGRRRGNQQEGNPNEKPQNVPESQNLAPTAPKPQEPVNMADVSDSNKKPKETMEVESSAPSAEDQAWTILNAENGQQQSPSPLTSQIVPPPQIGNQPGTSAPPAQAPMYPPAGVF